jgi:5-enolpyruvylshikimate-3-phosphate synthase
MSERPHPRFLTSLDASLEELQQQQRVVPMPVEAGFALAALRANLRARSAYLDATTALLLTKLLRGLAHPTSTSNEQS